MEREPNICCGVILPAIHCQLHNLKKVAPSYPKFINYSYFDNLKFFNFQGDDDEEINFEDLFSQFHKMKEMSKTLPESERKAYAEKVALAFYKSIGGESGDESED